MVLSALAKGGGGFHVLGLVFALVRSFSSAPDVLGTQVVLQLCVWCLVQHCQYLLLCLEVVGTS